MLEDQFSGLPLPFDIYPFAIPKQLMLVCVSILAISYVTYLIYLVVLLFAMWWTNRVKPVKLTTFIRWPPADVDHISVEPADSYVIYIYDHLRKVSTFICWITVYVSPREMEPRYALYLSILTMVVIQDSHISKSLCLISLVTRAQSLSLYIRAHTLFAR
jgi:hypothetical protein